MKKLTLTSWILAAVLALAAAPLFAQQSGSTLDKMDFGLNFTYKWAKRATAAPGPGFFIQGGSLDTAYTPGGRFKGLGLAVDANGESASSVTAGVNLSQLTFVAGPRYTQRGSRASVYAQSLFGVVHAFNSVFPGATGPLSSATAFASQFGGGLNVQFTQHLAWRVTELDYIYTRLPNNNTNSQSDIRLSTGVAFHF